MESVVVSNTKKSNCYQHTINPGIDWVVGLQLCPLKDAVYEFGRES